MYINIGGLWQTTKYCDQNRRLTITETKHLKRVRWEGNCGKKVSRNNEISRQQAYYMYMYFPLRKSACWHKLSYAPVPKAGIAKEVQLAFAASFRIASILAHHIVDMLKACTKWQNIIHFIRKPLCCLLCLVKAQCIPAVDMSYYWPP